MGKTKRRIFPVKGMGCAACVARVEGALKSHPGVQDVSVSLASSSARVDYDGSACTPEDLQKAVRDAGYDLIVEGTEDEADSEADQSREEEFLSLRKDTLLSAVISAVLMLLSMGFKDFPGKGFVLWAVATPVVVWCGRRFFLPAWRQLRHGAATMDTLVSLSVAISYLFSVFNLLFPGLWTSRGLTPHLYFESGAMIVTFVLLGRLLESRAMRATTRSVRSLKALQPSTVTVQRVRVDLDGFPEVYDVTVPVRDVLPGDIVIVKPGDRIPVDGVVSAGSSYVDESMLSGEPVPVFKGEGERVFTGTLNQNGTFNLRTERTGGDTVLSSIINMVRSAQGTKAPVQQTVDKVAAVFVPAIVAISILTLLIWIFAAPSDGIAMGLISMVSVLVIACPCALGLATPTAIIAGIGKAASHGILVKDAASLSLGRKIDTLVIDKTGTLTEGRPEVSESVWSEDSSLLRSILVSLESKSSHPLSGAIVSSLKGAPLKVVSDFAQEAGKGVSGEVDGVRYYVGSASYFEEVASSEAAKPAHIVSAASEWNRKGMSVIMLFTKDSLLAALGVSDKVRAGAAAAVGSLQRMGIDVIMLTGDNESAAATAAAECGIRTFRSGMLPADKAAYVSDLQRRGHIVAVAGDGINDSAALAGADIGISMGKGSDIAIDSSMMTLVSPDLGKIASFVSLSSKCVRIIRENLFWAFIYNIIAIPVAAGALYPVSGFLLNPALAAACMAASSVCVVLNSLRINYMR